ncbi:hypothetical protein BD324DRAFT_658098 [Kockovaella imperatae]|uniref:Uncharacterized protein n=1 Tax=Kockovaella imperatae TaxID=4999 RepID=A0A1Y1U970_9TREE|nr:hypothetical protein BD324DRAFT_658098 [Kockovaella imperatae]ORX34057.1 hypothetical protein BD324DRAFT_658098 [Kockovaella imperatae]
MGGNALGRQANRMSLPQHRAFSTYCQERLEPFFKGIYKWKDLKDKESHGDLDLVCAWDEYDPTAHVKGYEEDLRFTHQVQERKGIPSASNASPNSGLSVAGDGATVQAPGGKATWSKGLALHPDNLKFRAWVSDLAKALNASAWARNGIKTPIISFAVLCEDLPFEEAQDVQPTEEQKAAGHEPFWQVDCITVPSSTASFALLSTSYGDSLVVLSYALKILCPSFSLSSTQFNLKHSPFSGIPPIQVQLTTDPVPFCKWLGVDYDKWQATTFADNHELWEWLTNVEPSSILGTIWIKLAAPRKEDHDKDFETGDGTPVIRNHVRKISGVAKFLKWLRRPDSHWVKLAVECEAAKLGESTINPSSCDDTARSVASAEPSPISTSVEQLILDPGSPSPLDNHARDALTFWDCQSEYNVQYADRQGQARLLAERRQKHLENKAKQEAQLASLAQGVDQLKIVNSQVDL